MTRSHHKKVGWLLRVVDPYVRVIYTYQVIVAKRTNFISSIFLCINVQVDDKRESMRIVRKDSIHFYLKVVPGEQKWEKMRKKKKKWSYFWVFERKKRLKFWPRNYFFQAKTEFWNFYINIYEYLKPDLKNLMSGLSESVKKCTKSWKL